MTHSSGRVFIIVGARFVVLPGLATHYRDLDINLTFLLKWLTALLE